MASRSLSGPASGSSRQRSRTCSIRARYESMRAESEVMGTQSLWAGRARAVIRHVEGLGLHSSLTTALEQDLHFLLGGFQGALAVASQLDPALESLERLLEREVTALQSFHQAFELTERM